MVLIKLPLGVVTVSGFSFYIVIKFMIDGATKHGFVFMDMNVKNVVIKYMPSDGTILSGYISIYSRMYTRMSILRY